MTALYRTAFAPYPTLTGYARTVRLRERPFFYYDAGPADAPAILLIHGLGDEADTWRHLIEPLSVRYRVIAPDLPGFGRSVAPRGGLSGAFFAQTLADLLNELRITRAVLVGSSMGALLALRLAVARPAFAERLVLLNGAPALGHGAALSNRLLLMLLPGIGEAIYTSLRRDSDAAYATLRPYYADLDGLATDDRTFLYTRVQQRVWSNTQRRAYFSALRWLVLDGALRTATLRSRLPHLRIPTTFLWGAQDPVTPVANAYACAALLPNATVHVLPECGHLPQQEQPAAVLRYL